MATDPRGGNRPSRPRWLVPALLAASLALSAAVTVAAPDQDPPPMTATTTDTAARAATPPPTRPPATAPDADDAVTPADPATVEPTTTEPSPPVVAAANGAAVERPAIGALFDGPAEQPGDHFCSGAVVTSATGALIVTAAHCVADGDGTPVRTGMSFAPGYAGGRAPLGYWTVTSAVVPPGWLVSGDPGSDVAFLTVSRPDAPPVQQVTGAYRLAFDASGSGDGTPVTAVGYNDGGSVPAVVSGRATTLDDGQWQLDRPGLGQGASGGPWLLGPDESEILAVTGGYQLGGDSADVSYGVDLGPAALSAFRSTGGTD